MTEKEIKHYWSYFTSLCKRLDVTRQYVDHRSEDNELKNGNVNSFEFQQIIVLAAMEFENIAKIICVNIDETFDVQRANIRKITETIINKYPNIGETEIATDYQTLKPLKDWGIITIPESGQKRVTGISWWDDYSDLKHQTFRKFELATLKNAVNSLASLLVLELYLMQHVLGTVTLAYHVEYYNNNYSGPILLACGEDLPDFK